MALDSSPRGSRLLGRLAVFLTARPRTVVLVSLALAALAVTQIVGLRVSTSRLELGAHGRPFEQAFGRFLTEFGTPNDLIAVVDGGGPSEERAATDELSQALEARPAEVRSTFHRVDLDYFLNRALLFVPQKELAQIPAALSSQPVDRLRDGKLRGIDGVVDAITTAFGTLPGAALDPTRAKKGIHALDLLIGELDRRLSDPARHGLGNLRELVPPLATGALDDEGYLQSRDGSMRIAFISPASRSDETSVVLPLVTDVRAVARTVALRHGVRIRVTGMPALQADETKIVNRDVLFTTVLSLLLITIICLYGYRRPQQVLLSLVPLIIGILWTLAMVRLRYGEINLIASAFAPILLGRGSDFATYIIARYNALRALGASPLEAVRGSVASGGGGIITGALVTSAAFLVSTFGQFGPFSQLGWVVGVGLILILVASLTVTPALLVWVGDHRLPGERAFERLLERAPRFGRGPGAAALRWPGTVVGVTAAVVLVLGLFARKVPFDFDLLKFLPASTESVSAQRDLTERSDYGSDVAVVSAPDVAAARRLATELEQKPSVGQVESIASFLPDDQTAKLALIEKMRGAVTSIPPLAPPAPPTGPAALSAALTRLSDAVEDAAYESAEASHPTAAPLKRLSKTLTATLATEKALPAAIAAARVAHVEKQTFAALERVRDLLRHNVLDVHPVKLADLPLATQERFVGKTGKSAIYVFPKESDQGAALTAFVHDLRSVTPEVTGFPIIYYESSRSIRRGFIQSSGLALLVIVLALLIHFRSLGATLLALLPLGCAAVMMAGLMHLFHISHNVANIASLPLLLGLGTDYGLQMVHYHRLHPEESIDGVLRKTALGVFVAGGTTSAGFGALIFSRHLGARSLGLVLFLGTTAALACTLVLLPAILTLLRRRQRGALPEDEQPRQSAR